MNTHFPIRSLNLALLALMALAWAGLAAAQATAPEQTPLLRSSSGARSNVTLVIDNSGSMAYPFTYTYNVQSSTDANTAVAPATTPATFTNPWLAQRSSEVNSMYYNPRVTYRARVNMFGVALPPDPAGVTAPPDVRFVSNATSTGFLYSIVSNNDAPYTDTANAQVRNTFYFEHAATCGPGTTYCLVAATNPYMAPWQHPRHRRWIPNGAGTPVDSTGTLVTAAPAPSFTYFVCGPLVAGEANPPTVVRDTNNEEINCRFNAAQQQFTAGVRTGSHVRVITWGSTQNIGLPFDHKRTECVNRASNSCTNAEEIQNIVNWYKYYGTRSQATATAIGLAMASSSLQGGLRIGYYNINRQGARNTELLGVVNAPARLRGVRLLDANSTSASTVADTQQLYTWLYGYGSTPRGGTPLHRPLINVGEYYRGNQTGQTENPWAINPAGLPGELSCRRSFGVVFSDGAWTAADAAMPGTGLITDYVNRPGPTFTGLFNGNALSLGYLPTGPIPSNVITRKDYIPYPSAAGRSNGLADVAAYYYWHTDLRNGSADNIIAPKAGKPTFWQNMSTYTVGFMVRPSGSNGGSGLTFNQINNYRAAYNNNGVLGTTGTVLPSWPTVNLAAASEPVRVDDFLHAGYAGGARSFSVANADEVKRAFDTIFAETSDGAGNDAGVAVALTVAGGTTGSSDPVKYTTEYATGGNSGNVKAFSLDANNEVVDVNTADTVVPTPLWSAKDRINDRIVAAGNVTWRRLFTRNAGASATLHNGGSTVTAPSSALMTALDPTGFFPTDGREMVKYLLGDDTRVDRNGVPLRQRSSYLGAAVNSGPLLVYNNQDMAYYYPAAKTDTTTGSVVTDKDIDIHGREAYIPFLNQKSTFPPVVLSANNNGTVQVLNAAKVTTASTGETDLRPLGGGNRLKAGDELAAFMPSGVGSKLRLLSDETFLFQYILDGRMSEEDIFQKSGTTAAGDQDVGDWRQIVVGTSGRAAMGFNDTDNKVPGKGRFIYALNTPFVTEANGELKRIPSQADFLWEKSWPELGHVTNITTAGQLSAKSQTGSNAWVVLTNSGHYTNGGPAGLYVLNALTGDQIGFIPTTLDGGRGLGGVVALRDVNRRIVAAYAGDEKGNLWRFSLTGTWSATKIFTTAPVRPIYAAPTVQLAREGSSKSACTTAALDGKCGTIVVVGTGILLSDADRTNQDVQTIYGIWDPTPVLATESATRVPAHSAILTQTIDAASATPSTGTDAVKNIDTLYKVSSNPIDYQNTHMGWRLNIGNVIANTVGERVVTDLGNVGRSVVVTSTVVTTAGPSLESCGRGDQNPNVTYVLRAEDGANVAGFRAYSSKQLRNFSVGVTATGGFTNAILAGRTGGGNPSDLATFNPYAVGKTNESIIAPDKSNSNCTETGSNIEATLSGYGVDGCIKSDWQRTWRQLTSPPQ
jgi:type IV pilus assembly protein PilY1